MTGNMLSLRKISHSNTVSLLKALMQHVSKFGMNVKDLILLLFI